LIPSRPDKSAKRAFAMKVPATDVSGGGEEHRTWMPGTRPGMTKKMG
jgi:hypothetical protein